MSDSRGNLPNQPSRRTALVAMFLSLVILVFTVVAQQPETPVPSASAEEVARELLEIQERLGGSIVPASPQELLHPPADSPRPLSDTAKTQVDQLRVTAWKLDSAAHRLECVDLYSQSDALRELASQLRHDARAMKREAAKPE